MRNVLIALAIAQGVATITAILTRKDEEDPVAEAKECLQSYSNKISKAAAALGRVLETVAAPKA